MLIKSRCIIDSFMVVLPVIFIEWRQLDKITVLFVFMTFFFIYHSLQYSHIDEHNNNAGPYVNTAVFFITAAFLIAAVDVRFLHIGDKIPLKVRYNALIIYVILSMLKTTALEMLYKSSVQPCPVHSIVYTRKTNPVSYTISSLLHLMRGRQIVTGIYYFSSIAALAAGQVTMNSRLSVIVVIPAILLILLEFTERNGKPLKRDKVI